MLSAISLRNLNVNILDGLGGRSFSYDRDSGAMMTIVSAVASFASGKAVRSCFLPNRMPHPIASSWEWNAVPPA